jgi:transposase InsO family protein
MPAGAAHTAGDGVDDSTWSGVVYVAFVIDVFSRRSVGWKAARTMHANLVVDALNMAAWTRRGTDLDGLICHHDAGSQYTSIAYTDAVAELEARASIGTVGDNFDNAMAEAVNALYKTELHRNPADLAPTAATGRVSTTAPQQRSKRPTTVTSLRPTRPEKTNPTSTRQTQAESVVASAAVSGSEAGGHGHWRSVHRSGHRTAVFIARSAAHRRGGGRVPWCLPLVDWIDASIGNVGSGGGDVPVGRDSADRVGDIDLDRGCCDHQR